MHEDTKDAKTLASLAFVYLPVAVAHEQAISYRSVQLLSTQLTTTRPHRPYGAKIRAWMYILLYMTYVHIRLVLVRLWGSGEPGHVLLASRGVVGCALAER